MDRLQSLREELNWYYRRIDLAEVRERYMEALKVQQLEHQYFPYIVEEVIKRQGI